MPSHGTLRRVGLVKSYVSEEYIAYIFKVEEITRERKCRQLLTLFHKSYLMPIISFSD
jgi:hypothetical protein